MSAPRLLGGLVAPQREVFGLLEQSAEITVQAAERLETLVHHWPGREDLLDELAAHRRDSEAAADAVFTHGHATFVTALDRDDLIALSNAMTAVVAHAERTCGLLGAYRVERAREPARRITHVLTEASRELAAGVAALRQRQEIPATVTELRRLERDAERLLRDALSDLLADAPAPAALLGWRDIYDELEHALGALGTGTRTLQAIELKGH